MRFYINGPRVFGIGFGLSLSPEDIKQYSRRNSTEITYDGRENNRAETVSQKKSMFKSKWFWMFSVASACMIVWAIATDPKGVVPEMRNPSPDPRHGKNLSIQPSKSGVNRHHVD